MYKYVLGNNFKKKESNKNVCTKTELRHASDAISHSSAARLPAWDDRTNHIAINPGFDQQQQHSPHLPWQYYCQPHDIAFAQNTALPPSIQISIHRPIAAVERHHLPSYMLVAPYPIVKSVTILVNLNIRPNYFRQVAVILAGIL